MIHHLPMATHADDYRPRELRHKALVAARLCVAGRWVDGRILNISSRGMMVEAGNMLSVGQRVELRKGSCRATAEVRWCNGGTAGLSCDDRLTTYDWIEDEVAGSMRVTFGRAGGERRAVARVGEDARDAGRRIEFMSMALAVMLGAAALSMTVYDLVSTPLSTIEAALARPPGTH